VRGFTTARTDQICDQHRGPAHVMSIACVGAWNLLEQTAAHAEGNVLCRVSLTEHLEETDNLASTAGSRLTPQAPHAGRCIRPRFVSDSIFFSLPCFNGHSKARQSSPPTLFRPADRFEDQLHHGVVDAIALPPRPTLSFTSCSVTRLRQLNTGDGLSMVEKPI
jgi:hypothetical protein